MGTLDISPLLKVGYRGWLWIWYLLGLGGSTQKAGSRTRCVPGVGRWEGQGVGTSLKIPTAAWHSKPGGAGPQPTLKIQECQGLPRADTL